MCAVGLAGAAARTMACLAVLPDQPPGCAHRLLWVPGQLGQLGAQLLAAVAVSLVRGLTLCQHLGDATAGGPGRLRGRVHFDLFFFRAKRMCPSGADGMRFAQQLYAD